MEVSEESASRLEACAFPSIERESAYNRLNMYEYTNDYMNAGTLSMASNAYDYRCLTDVTISLSSMTLNTRPLEHLDCDSEIARVLSSTNTLSASSSFEQVTVLELLLAQ